MYQNDSLMVRNLNVKHIKKAVIYFYSLSLGFLPKPKDQFPDFTGSCVLPSSFELVSETAL